MGGLRGTMSKGEWQLVQPGRSVMLSLVSQMADYLRHLAVVLGSGRQNPARSDEGEDCVKDGLR